jgi:hypothetical protein
LHGTGGAKASLHAGATFLHPKRAALRMSALSAFVRLYEQEGPIEPNLPTEESAMNAQYNASSRPARSVIAMLACVATVTVLASIGGLAEHYSDQAQLASVKAVSVAQR